MSILWKQTVRKVSCLALTWGAGLAALPAAAWQPGEIQVSAEKELIDYEFSQTRGMFTWADASARLWVGTVDRDTGLFTPLDGRGTLVDPDAISIKDARITYNGPEWIHQAAGDMIVYTKFVPGKPHNKRTARLAQARLDRDGAWTFNTLSPDAPRMAPYASDYDADRGPIFTYIDKDGNHYWREPGPVNSEHLIADAVPSQIPIRPVRGARGVVFPKAVDGIKQIHRLDIDTNVLEQVTFDGGDKAAPWMWMAPEFNNEFVVSTVSELALRIYRKLPTPDGSTQWTPVHSVMPPAGFKIYSPEPFTYNGRSYVFLAFGRQDYDFPSEVWITNIDASQPLLRRISDDTPLRVRADPEVFITSRGPMIYFNRFTPTDTDPPQTCFSVACSEGVWMSDPGLGP